MALVHPQIGVITVMVKDDDGARSTMTFYGWLPTINDWAQGYIDETKEQLWAVLEPLTDAALVGINFSLPSYDDTYPSATAGSDVEDKGVWLLLAEGNHKGSLTVASIKEDKLVASGATAGIEIDLSDEDVGAFNTAMLDGIDLSPFGLADTVTFGTSRGEAWEQTTDAYKQNRKSQKSRNYRG